VETRGIGIDRKREPGFGREKDDNCHGEPSGWRQQGRTIPIPIAIPIPTIIRSSAVIREIRGPSPRPERFSFPSPSNSPNSWQSFACGGWGEGGYGSDHTLLFVRIRVHSPACLACPPELWRKLKPLRRRKPGRRQVVSPPEHSPGYQAVTIDRNHRGRGRYRYRYRYREETGTKSWTWDRCRLLRGAGRERT
jgi:hypothetical protein